MSFTDSIVDTFKSAAGELLGKSLIVVGALVMSAGTFLLLGPQKLLAGFFLIIGLVILIIGAGAVNYGKKQRKKSVRR